MAGTHFSIDTSGLEPLAARLRGLATMDTAALMPRIGEHLLASTRKRFSTETAPNGAPWAALKHPSRKKHKKDKILTLRGFLRGSGLRYQPEKRSVAVGTNLIYGATHQFGRDNIPARPFLGLSDADRAELLEITLDWLRGR
ncbi:phage virion morphogenesis protein [Ottowia sp.]|uniref:phage virion morphogenesis protein n=1 Tax=Ottowia sp. TaxID=1898956 RepID=UPI003A83BB44